MTAAEKVVLVLGLATLTALPVYLACLLQAAFDLAARRQDEAAASLAGGQQRPRDINVSEGL